MSLKDGGGKSLKGNKSAQLGGAVDMKALLAALTTAGVTLINVTLQNMIAFSGMMDDVMIGSIQQSSAAFTKVQIGMPGVGGPFIAYGDKIPDMTYDDNGEVTSMTGGDMIKWDPATALLDVLGKLQVRDEARFGNIVIRENQVVAVAPDDGNVEIVPQSNKGYILLNGNVEQNGQGTVRFDKANDFSVDSDANAVVNARDNNLITTERGDITLATDTKAITEILSIEHSESTHSEIVTTDLATDIVTQVVIDQTIDATSMSTTETTTIDRVITMIRKVTKRRTTVDGEPATITDTEISVLNPESGVYEVQTASETTLDADVPNPFTRIPDGVTTHKAIVTTMTPHGLLTGDVITINGTNSNPSYDGSFTAGTVISNTKFELPADTAFTNSSSGRIVIPKTGNINISASDHVRFEIQVPIVFGQDGLSYRPQIEATSQDSLVLSAHYLQSLDPIITLRSPSTVFSDSGIAVNYVANGEQKNGFFGFVNNTENFTWIPSATIVRNPDGSKSVLGKRGIMELRGVQLQDIIGDPNINIRTPQGGVFFDSKEPITIAPSLNIGTSGNLGQGKDESLVITSKNDIRFEPKRDVVIPESTRLTFSDSTSIVGLQNGGLQITSADAPTTFNSNVNIPLGNTVTVGKGSIYGEENNLVLTAQNAVRVPDDVYLQIGDIANTGFVAHDGVLNTRAVSDLNLQSGGNMDIAAAGNLSVTAGTGVTNLNSTQVIMPAKSELLFSSDNYISTIHGDGLTLHSSNINLDAVTSINIPENIPIKFGENSTIASSSTDGGLHIRDPSGVFVDQNLTVAGTFTVYGPVSEITSVHTVITDPIITLGKTTTPEYVKDRGIEFQYGNGLTGFMGFSQQDGKFYLVKEGHNENEVYTKDVLGDLMVNKVSADIISSSGGFASKTLNGDPYLDIKATYIDLTASEHVKIPTDIPLQFGEGSSHYIVRSSVEDTLQIVSPNVNVTEGKMSIGSVDLTANNGLFNIENLSELKLDATLTIPKLLQFSDDASIGTDADGNLVFSTSNGFVFSKPLDFTTDGYTLGKAKVYYDTVHDRIAFANRDGITPMDFSVSGDIYDARWVGDTIETQYGGTGRANNWHAKSVIFVNHDDKAFNEDPAHFMYDVVTQKLGLRTNTPSEALTIGDNGNIDFLSDSSGIIFRTTGAYSWRVGKTGNNFSVSGGTPTSVLSDLQSLFTINPNKQIAVGVDTESYFASLDGNSNTKIVIGKGDVQYAYLDSALRWSTCTYIKSNSATDLIISSCNYININAPNDVSIASSGSFKVNAAAVSITSTNNVSFLGGGDLSMEISGKTNWHANGDITVKTPGALDMFGDTAINFTTKGPFTFTSGGNFTFNSGSADMTINTGNNMRLTSGSTMIFNSGLDCKVVSGANFTVDAGANTIFNTPSGDIKLSSGVDLYLSAIRHILCNAGSAFDLRANSISATSNTLMGIISKGAMTFNSESTVDIFSSTGTSITSTTGDVSLKALGTGNLVLQSARFLLQTALDASIRTSTDMKTEVGNNMDLVVTNTTTVKSKDLYLDGKKSITFITDTLSQTTHNGVNINNIGDYIYSNTGNVFSQVTGNILSDVTGTLTQTSNTFNVNNTGAYSIVTAQYNAHISSTATISSTGAFEINTADVFTVTSTNAFSLKSTSSPGTISSYLDLSLSSITGNVNVTSAGDIKNTATRDISIITGNIFKVSSVVGLELNGNSGYVSITGSSATLASNTTLQISAGSNISVTSGGISTIDGAGGLNITSLKSVNILGNELVDINSNSLSFISAGAFKIQGGASSSITSATDLLIKSNILSLTSTNGTEISGSFINVNANTNSQLSFKENLSLIVGAKFDLLSNDIACTTIGKLVANIGDSLSVTAEKGVSVVTKDTVNVSATGSISQTTATTHTTNAILGIETTSTSGYVRTIAKTDFSVLSETGKISLETVKGSVVLKSADSITGNAINNISFVAATLALQSVSGSLSLHSASILDVLANDKISVESKSSISVKGTQYTLGFTDGVVIDAGTNVYIRNPMYVQGPISIGHISNIISGTAAGILTIETPTQITLQSPHVLIPQRLCLYHDDHNVCCIYQQKTPDNDLLFTNTVGDILLRPLHNVKLPDAIHMQFGDSGYIGGTGETMRIVTTTGNIDLSPGSKSVYLSIDTSLNFGNMAAITQTSTKFDITSQMPIVMDAQTVFLPDHTKLVFGDVSRRIESDGDTLFIYSTDLLSLESNTVRVTGNLIVSKRSTFTVESETVFDSGVITVGGGTSREILRIAPNADLGTGDVHGTLVTVSGEGHNLRLSDTVSLIDTVPNIDGTYKVASVPSTTSFTIDKITPAIPTGTTTGGTVRYALVTNPGFDDGIQFNWHTGNVADTTGSRTGFFGFDRSTGRFTYIPEATRSNNVYSGAPGDFQMNNIYANGLSVEKLISALDTNTQVVQGSHFLISGGAIDSTPVGFTSPASGRFTDLHVEGTLSVGGGGVIKNLNADLLDGYHAEAFVLRDGSTPLTGNWDAGGYRIVTAGLSDTLLAKDGIVTVGENGRLQTDSKITFINGNLTVPNLSGFKLTGDIDLNGFSLKNGIVTQSNITNSTMTASTLNDTSVKNSTFSNGLIHTVSLINSNIADTSFIKGTISTSALDTVTVTKSVLTDVDVSAAKITESTYTSGNIASTNVSNSTVTTSTLTNNIITDNTISGGTIKHLDISDVVVSNSILRDVTVDIVEITNGLISASLFRDGTLTNSTFKDGSITGTQIDTSTVNNSAFTNGNIEMSVFANGNVNNSTMDIISLTNGTITNSLYREGIISDTDIDTSRIVSTDIIQSRVNSSTLENNDITNSRYTNGEITETRISNVQVTNSTADTVAITNGTLVTGNMDGYHIVNTAYSQGTIADTVISTSAFNNGSLSNNTANELDISNSRITDTSISTSIFRDGDILNTNIGQSRISSTDITESVITHTQASTLSVTDSNVDTSIIVNSEFNNGKLSNNDFTTGSITASNVSNTDITTSRINDSAITSSTVQDTAMTNSTITGTDISESNIDQSVMTNSDIKTTNIADSDISASRMTNSDVSDSRIKTTVITDSNVGNTTISTSSFNNGEISLSNITKSTMDKSDITASHFTKGTITQSTFVKGDIQDSNISLEKGNVMDASRGTIKFANDQIHGDWIAGGMADIDISGNSETVTNGVYRRDFAEDHTILKADVAGEPHSMVVPEETLVGRRTDGLIDALTVENVQEMLDIVQKKWFKDNSILKADTASNPVALEVPPHTIIGRYPGDSEKIAALTAEQVIQMIMTTEVLHRYGAMLRDGHKTFPDGGQMTGLIYYSTERFSLTTGQQKALDINVETSYVSLNYSRAGGRVAKVTLGRGIADGHRKVIIASHVAEKAILQIECDFVAPEMIDPIVFAVYASGQSAHLQWDSVLSRWLIVGSGCAVLTRDQLRDPDWINNLGLDD